MIDQIDEALRKLLIAEIPIKKNEIDVQFDQPKREWSARLSRPTLNLFLYDVRENVKLRSAPYAEYVTESRNGKDIGVQRRRHVRVDLHYLLTAWATRPEDEHRLLGRLLYVFFRHGSLPAEYLPESVVENQPVAIPMRAAQYDTMEKPSDIWNVMDNQQKAGINLRLTVAIYPWDEPTAPITTGAEFMFSNMQMRTGREASHAIGGMVRSAKHDPSQLKVTLVERGLDVPLQEEGRFVMFLQPGEYTLQIEPPDGKAKKQKFSVPSPEYTFEI